MKGPRRGFFALLLAPLVHAFRPRRPVPLPRSLPELDALVRAYAPHTDELVTMYACPLRCLALDNIRRGQTASWDGGSEIRSPFMLTGWSVESKDPKFEAQAEALEKVMNHMLKHLQEGKTECSE